MTTDEIKNHITISEETERDKTAYESSEEIFGRITYLETEICEAMFEFKTKFM
ncbi:MAG: hypothetical protein IJZ06_06215 [Bacteroidales bacterium]|nr:hypothetical protein [Bacteroidales bacterium]